MINLFRKQQDQPVTIVQAAQTVERTFSAISFLRQQGIITEEEEKMYVALTVTKVRVQLHLDEPKEVSNG